MFNRIKVVTSLLLVLVLFGALQLISGGLFFSSLKSDKENFTVLQTIRQQQLLLSESRVDLLQARNSLNRAGIRYMMDTNKIGSGATIDELLAKAKKSWRAPSATTPPMKNPRRTRVRILRRRKSLSSSMASCTARCRS
ncbi:Methyl-accepting chemotaxis protein I (serine chemoreceptor protein) (plasmid) [Klebsiella aerogenes]|nr:Methyl-accepting chemotaxis protein I (serine chemoreceptor protein) [Klebsiella aerogenes]